MTKASLEQELKNAIAEVNRIVNELETQTRVIDEIVAKRDNLAKIGAETNLRIVRIKELLVIESGLSRNTLRLYNKLAKARKAAKSEKITVAQLNDLHSKVTNLETELQKSCPHTFLLSYDGYEGSYINEHSDAYHGQRRCVVCKLHESSKSTRDDVYSILGQKEGRLVKRDIRDSRKERIWEEPLSLDLDYVIEAFRRSAGCMNLNWPIIKDGKVTEKSDCFFDATP